MLAVQALKPICLAYKVSTPHVISNMGFGCWGFGLGLLLGLVILGPAGPSGFGLICILKGPLWDLVPIWKIRPYLRVGCLIRIWALDY